MAHSHIQITTHSVTETRQLGQTLGAGIHQSIIIALTGDLGSGKTSFVQGLAKGLDVSEKYYITSPTFTLISEYPGRYRLFHVDLYRIEHIPELEEIGLDEVLDQDAVIAIEWADKLPEGTLSGHLLFQFKLISDESRQIDIFAYGHPESNLLKAAEKHVQAKFRPKSRSRKCL
ncbi:MAG: tRNA (adenosine(37)-N6)-threonylcarbamoyltransferase complex ATPase subunit type 1 TsaE [Desulfobacterales bacterium]|jgi:tRNA threonylcarbamoyladenosine biosynthesis protein TsaE